MNRCLLTSALVLTAALSCTRSPTPTGAARPGAVVLDRAGELAFVRLDVPGFEQLRPAERVLLYHLTQAALAGDPIYFDQTHKQHLTVRALFYELLRHRGHLDAAFRSRFVPFVKRFWAHHGLYDPWTMAKMQPEFTAADLRKAVRMARQAGATFGVESPEQIDTLLQHVEPLLFDPAVDPVAIQKDPPPGHDILLASAANYYDGVRLEDLEGFVEHHPENSRLVKREGALVEEVYRAGTGDIPPGRYATELKQVIRHLLAARAVAAPELQTVLDLLIRYLETGDRKHFEAYNVAWVHYDGDVDLILGFIESYDDPRGVKAAWEGVVLLRDRERARAITALAQNAAYFESRMPWHDSYKRQNVQSPKASSFFAVAESGDGGPVTAVGINLPNAQSIRQVHGSKSFHLSNVDTAANALYRGGAIGEFSWDAAEVAEARRCGETAWSALVALHEVVGHGSGRVSPVLEGEPMQQLAEFRATLEEARSDLVALYHAHDPKTVAIGLLPDSECADEMIRGFVRGFIPSLRKVPTGTVIEADHLRAASLILGVLRSRGVVERQVRDGKTFLRVPDVQRARTAIAELLAELMRIKATGDLPAIRDLVEKHATQIDAALRDEALRRTRAAGMPSQAAYVAPRMIGVRNPAGVLVDARLEPVGDLADYILAFEAAGAPPAP